MHCSGVHGISTDTRTQTCFSCSYPPTLLSLLLHMLHRGVRMHAKATHTQTRIPLSPRLVSLFVVVVVVVDDSRRVWRCCWCLEGRGFSLLSPWCVCLSVSVCLGVPVFALVYLSFPLSPLCNSQGYFLISVVVVALPPHLSARA
jgi:hypothetical protein